MKKIALLMAIVGFAGASVQAQPQARAQTQSSALSASQIVNSAADALGGKAKIMAVKFLVIQGHGSTWQAGDVGVSPDAEPDRTLITDYRRVMDLASGRMRLTQTGVFQYPFALAVSNQADQRLDGDIAFGPAAGGFGGGGAAAAPAAAGAEPRMVRASPAVAHQRRMDFLSNPLAAVRAALDPAAKLSNTRSVAAQQLVDVVTPQGESFTLGIDTATRLPHSFAFAAADPNLGDVVNRVEFSDYQDVNGIKLPQRLLTFTDRWRTGDLQIACSYSGAADSDDLYGDLAAPASLRDTPAPQPQAAPVMVTADPVAKGIWYMGGTGEHSILFEFADHLVLFETPGGDARTLAVIQKARETVPGKPLTIAINSHHHFDHAGGFRAAVSEGLTMYAYKDNVDHFKEIASRPHTMEPDALQKNPKPLKIVPVNDMLEMKDAQMDIILYHVHPDGVTHAATELMVWVPRDRILVEADQYDHGWFRHLWGENFIWNVETLRKLSVDRILPVHGNGPEDWSEVVSTIRSKPEFFRTQVPDF